ncbi:MAG: tRNA (N6-threonylcarbamoyladenosine(37)-N6)-methyltransferase TrmO [Candidatus Freyarchaeota archaeon]
METFIKGVLDGRGGGRGKLEVRYKPIGVIHSPFKRLRGIPIQSVAAERVHGTVEVFPEYAEGLKDLEGFSHIFLIYHFHLVGKPSLRVKPYMDDQERGVFATRAPARPNPIGISVVRLLKVEGVLLQVQGLDVVDGTPLLDIKPYVPQFDSRKAEKIGWLENRIHKLHVVRDDERFAGAASRRAAR